MHNIEKEIKDIKTYTSRMERSLMDKLFFIDKVFEPIDTILDFGCANGTIIYALKSLFPEYRYVGYDINPAMISLAKQTAPDCNFHSIWESISVSPNTTLLNISSTIHEVYSYGESADIEMFWNRVFNSNFKYIAIRDMIPSQSTNRFVDKQQLSLIKSLYPTRVNSFEKIWGKISTQKALVHFLLKYDYVENWEREVRENYFPITVEELLAKIPPQYEIVYSEHYTLPYIKQKIYHDIGITLNDATHFKILLKLRS